jgi:two-component system LytT family sensor kinase
VRGAVTAHVSRAIEWQLTTEARDVLKSIRWMAVSGLIWLMIALISSGQVLITQPARMGRLLPINLALNVPTYTFWWLITPVLFYLANRFRLDDGARVVTVGVHVAGALTVALVPSAASAWFILIVDPTVLPSAASASGRTLLAIRYGSDIITYFAVVVVATGIRLWDSSRSSELHAARLEGALAVSRLEALSVQMQPHFLYNALNSVAMLIRAGSYDNALNAVVGYGALLRAVLDPDATELPLREEVAFIRRYLELELLRFPGSFTTSIELGSGTADALVPRLVLLPLVENALHHAFSGAEASAHLTIAASARNGHLHVTVSDNARGMPAGAPPPDTRGLGVANTRRRLAACYGDDQALEYDSAPGRGTSVHMRMPCRVAAVA